MGQGSPVGDAGTAGPSGAAGRGGSPTPPGSAGEQASRVGAPATAVLEVAAETDADHIVLGGRKRSPARSLLFGSVTQAVLLDADRPVSVTGGEK